MICSCGARYPDIDEACRFCGTRNANYVPPEPVKEEPPVDPRFSGQPLLGYEAISEQRQFQNNYQFEQSRAANSAANVSLISGILGIFLAGLILGVFAIVKGRKARRLGYVGAKATAGIFLGVFDVVFWAFAVYLLYEYAQYFA